MIDRYKVIGFSLMLVLAACATKESVSGLPVPSSRMEKASGVPVETLGKGYALFRHHCGQCHALKMPKDVRVAQWHRITPKMAWNVGLEKSDEKALLAYLDAASRQMHQEAR